MTKANTETKKHDNVLEQLELVDVAVKDGRATMTFLDAEAGQIREVGFNKKVYDRDKEEFVDNADKAEQCEQWAQEYFGTTFDELGTAVGQKHDIYVYDRFNSLWYVDVVNKFDKDDEGIIFESPIVEVIDDGIAIRTKLEYEGKTYENKMTYAEYLESRKEWFVNPQKKSKQEAKFKEKFGVTPAEAVNGAITGQPVMCEVKIAFGKFPYIEIKNPRWAKK